MAFLALLPHARLDNIARRAVRARERAPGGNRSRADRTFRGPNTWPHASGHPSSASNRPSASVPGNRGRSQPAPARLRARPRRRKTRVPSTAGRPRFRPCGKRCERTRGTVRTYCASRKRPWQSWRGCCQGTPADEPTFWCTWSDSHASGTPDGNATASANAYKGRHWLRLRELARTVNGEIAGVWERGQWWRASGGSGGRFASPGGAEA